MTIPLTKYHTLVISGFGYDCQAGYWNVDYDIEDSLTGLKKHGSLALDRVSEEENKTPKEISKRLVEFLRGKGYV